MKILHGPDLAVAIRGLFEGHGRLRCAVAFWGPKLGELALKRKAEVVLDISMGGTSRNALRALGLRRKALPDAAGCVKVLDGLHAKLYISEQTAIICSANASQNALGGKGLEPKLHEAGVLIDRANNQHGYDEAVKLFKRYQELARLITPDDFDRAVRAPTNPAARDYQNNAGPASPSLLQSLLEYPQAYADAAFIFGDRKIGSHDLSLAKEAYLDEVGEELDHSTRSHIATIESSPKVERKLRRALQIIMYWFADSPGLYAYHDIVRAEQKNGDVSYFGRRNWRTVRSALPLPNIRSSEIWLADQSKADQLADKDGEEKKERFVILTSGELYEKLEKDMLSRGSAA